MRRSSRQSAAKANDALLSGDKKDVSSTDVARDEPKGAPPPPPPSLATPTLADALAPLEARLMLTVSA